MMNRVDSDLTDDVTPEQRLAELERRAVQAETALRLNAAKLRMALDVSRLGAWQCDQETGEVTGTPAFKAYFGLPPDAPLTYDGLRAMFHPDDVARIDQAVSYALKTRTDFNIEHRIIRADGRPGRIHVRGGVIAQNGKPVYTLGVVQDITERDRAREEITLAQRRQEFLLELNDQLGTLDDPHQIMETAARHLARFLDIDAASYGEVFEERGDIVVEREWSKGIISNEGKVEKFDQLAEFELFALRHGEPVIVEDVKADLRLRGDAHQARYTNMNIRSLVCMPVLRSDHLKAVLSTSSAAPRVWTGEDVALIEDVAERTWLAIEKSRAERGLRETETRFGIIAESLLVWIVDPNISLTYANERWAKYSGLPPEEALGHSWMQAIHPDDMARMHDELKSVMADRTPYATEVRYQSHTGAYRWHLIQAEPFYKEGEFSGWVGTSVDIHDLKETEAALRLSEERLSLAQQAAGIGVFDWDMTTGHITWTAEQERLFGIAAGTFKGDISGWEDKVHPDDRATTNRVMYDAIARRDTELSLIYRAQPSEGSTRTFHTIASVIYDADGKPVRMVGTNIDVTHARQAEERQHLLIRELHHRVKNTLATVQAIVGSTARTSSSIDEFYQGFVGRIVSLARTHNLLTEDLWQRADLHELVETELGPYEDEARNRILIEGPHVDLPSEAAVPIGMAIHELTTNAAKHGALSTFGGQVEVRWSIETDGDGPMLHFAWTENGGPRVATPGRQGFGSRLLQRVLSTQLQAQVNMDFPEEGLHFTMSMPIPGAPPLFNPDA
ncbi:PAS domain-containing protein [Microvirga sp. TS319]|uniref:PAS domain-containing protein n=1 Tax=Microvirga sp. TS319 TaxID=3241165 RepID=UPI003519DFA8